MLARVDELEVNPHIDREEIRRMKAAGVSRGQRRRLTRYRVATKIADEKAKAAMGKNTPQSVMGSKSEGNPEYIASHGDKKKKTKPMSIKKINRARGSGLEGMKARFFQDEFNRRVSRLARER